MAQEDNPESSATGSSTSSASAARLNAAAPEFTPRSAAQYHNHGNNPHRRGSHHHHQPHHHHHYHHHQSNQHYQPRHQHHQAEDEGSAAATAEDREGPAGAGQAQHRLPEPETRKLVKQVPFLCPRSITPLPAVLLYLSMLIPSNGWCESGVSREPRSFCR
jgi:La-related protein 7